MKKKNNWRITLYPLVLTISCYVVFYTRIASKPGQAGFWLILAMGMALGVFLSHLFQGVKRQGQD